MAQISKPPIPYKVYKHFAVVTVVLTASLAMFADGENREAMEEQLAPDVAEEQARFGGSQPRPGDEPKLVRASGTQAVSGSFDNREFDTGFGKPMNQQSGGGASSYNPFAEGEDGERTLPGYSQAYLDSLSEEEYARLVESLREAGVLNPEGRERQIAAVERSASRRNGQQFRIE